MRHKDKAALSVVIITRDEADMLPDCLQSIRWADEFVVYDSGSPDATIDIARCYTDKVYVDADWQGFGGPAPPRPREGVGGLDPLGARGRAGHTAAQGGGAPGDCGARCATSSE